MLPGPCCIAIATLEPVNGDSWYHMCAFRFHFWGRKVNWNQASHVRASSVPNLYAFCLNKRTCIFVRTGRPLLLILRFCGLIFGTARRSQKWDRENAFLLCFYWAVHTVPKNAFLQSFYIRVEEAQCFGVNRNFVAYGDRKGNVPNLYAFCLNKRTCIFVRTGRPLLLILRFCGLIFGTARRSQKWDRENAFLLCFYWAVHTVAKNGTARRSHFWDRV